jgi:hypothetical protein
LPSLSRRLIALQQLVLGMARARLISASAADPPLLLRYSIMRSSGSLAVDGPRRVPPPVRMAATAAAAAAAIAATAAISQYV